MSPRNVKRSDIGAEDLSELPLFAWLENSSDNPLSGGKRTSIINDEVSRDTIKALDTGNDNSDEDNDVGKLLPFPQQRRYTQKKIPEILSEWSLTSCAWCGTKIDITSTCPYCWANHDEHGQRIELAEEALSEDWETALEESSKWIGKPIENKENQSLKAGQSTFYPGPSKTVGGIYLELYLELRGVDYRVKVNPNSKDKTILWTYIKNTTKNKYYSAKWKAIPRTTFLELLASIRIILEDPKTYKIDTLKATPK